MKGGRQDRAGYDLVRCDTCAGNVFIKVPKKDGVKMEKAIKGNTGARAVAPRPKQSSILVKSMFYHQRDGESPVSMNPTFERVSVGVAESPRTLDTIEVGPGWVAVPGVEAFPRVGVVIIQNQSGYFNLRPTAEQFAEAMKLVVEYGFGDRPSEDGDLFVSPRQFVQVEIKDVRRLRLRCPAGTAPVRVTVIPG